VLLVDDVVNVRNHATGDDGRASLRGLPESSRERLLACCRKLSVPSGQALFDQGSLHVCSYILQEGLVRTYYTAVTGREVTLGYWSEGDLVGGPNFFGGGYHIWSGTAVRSSRALSISDGDLKRLSVEDPDILFWVAETMAFKLRWLSILFQLHGTEPVRQRLAKLLVMLSRIYGVPDVDGSVVIKHRINQGDLATLVGATRQWTNKTLNELKKMGLLDMANRQIRILDLDSLNSMSGEEADLFV
jgi:CRP-like cAMP-binding protein